MPDRRTLKRITLYVVSASLALSAVSFALFGVTMGVGTLAGAAVGILNWLAMRWVGERILVANDRGRAVWGTLLALKMGASLAVVWGILSTGLADPTGFTVGLGGLVLGVLLGAFHSAAARMPNEASEERG